MQYNEFSSFFDLIHFQGFLKIETHRGIFPYCCSFPFFQSCSFDVRIRCIPIHSTRTSAALLASQQLSPQSAFFELLLCLPGLECLLLISRTECRVLSSRSSRLDDPHRHWSRLLQKAATVTNTIDSAHIVTHISFVR